MSAKFVGAVLLFCIGMTGCVSVPPTRSTEGIKSDTIASHVNFLAQPALKGRKPETRGSRIARSYIIERFKAYGLVPWGQEKDYVQSFGYGNNIIGVLQGADKNLAEEVVLVCAHYDHVGKEHGKICPGAADNASGVAALLETAKQMSLFEHRPKRTVVFAAFDAEEMNLLGSFAFACRPDVEQARVVAVLNVDILGRDFMDVVGNTLFVTGTEQYPALREQIFRSGTNASVDVRPIGTDLIGPRGDHAAFELRPIPCMFFSSGMYGDYHKPTDTSDKLNYAAAERSTRVVFETVRELANGGEIRRVPLANGCDPEELRTVTKVMSELSGKNASAKDAELFKKLATETKKLAESGEYNPRTRAKLIADASGTLAPYFLDMGGSQSLEQQKQMSVLLPFLQQLYLDHKNEMLEGYKQLVLHILKYRPSLIRNMPKFSYEIFKITDDDIALNDRGDGKYSLNVLITRASVSAQKGLLGFRGGIGVWLDGINGEGTKEQLIDLCLLRLRRERSNELHVTELTKVLHAVTGTKAGYEDLLAQRIKESGSETKWLVNCMLSDCPELALAATSGAAKEKDASVRSAVYKIIMDRSVRSDVRAAAIELAGGWKDKEAVSALSSVLDDTTVAYKREYVAELNPGYPFADRVGVKESLLPFYEEMWKQSHKESKTIGELAAAAGGKVTRANKTN